MRQIESKKGADFGLDLGRRAVRIANKVMWAKRAADERKKLAAQNAYRRAIGLPEIKSS